MWFSIKVESLGLFIVFGASPVGSLDISTIPDSFCYAALLHRSMLEFLVMHPKLISSFLINRRLRVNLDGKSKQEYTIEGFRRF